MEADAAAAADACAAHRQPKPNLQAAINGPVMTTEAWNNSQYGPALCKYEGEHIVPGETMSLDTVRKLFRRMSSVNMCPCREVEEQNWGWNQMLQMTLSYVEKDLVYDKEHAQLANKAEAWVRAVHNSAPQPLLQDSEAAYWTEWLSRAEKHSLHPVPTKKNGGFCQGIASAFLAAQEGSIHADYQLHRRADGWCVVQYGLCITGRAEGQGRAHGTDQGPGVSEVR